MQSNFLDPILRSNPANSQQVQATSSSERADRVSLRRIRSFDTTNAVVVTGSFRDKAPLYIKKSSVVAHKYRNGRSNGYLRVGCEGYFSLATVILEVTPHTLRVRSETGHAEGGLHVQA